MIWWADWRQAMDESHMSDVRLRVSVAVSSRRTRQDGALGYRLVTPKRPHADDRTWALAAMAGMAAVALPEITPA